MRPDADRPRTKRAPRRDLLLLALIAIGCWLFAPQRGEGAGWHVDVRVAGVRISMGMGATSVRERTPLFDIGQVALAWRR